MDVKYFSFPYGSVAKFFAKHSFVCSWQYSELSKTLDFFMFLSSVPPAIASENALLASCTAGLNFLLPILSLCSTGSVCENAVTQRQIFSTTCKTVRGILFLICVVGAAPIMRYTPKALPNCRPWCPHLLVIAFDAVAGLLDNNICYHHHHLSSFYMMMINDGEHIITPKLIKME